LALLDGDSKGSCATTVTITGPVTQQWKTEMPDAGRPTAPVTAGGLVFVGYENGVLRASDSATGKERWQAFLAGPIYVSR